MRASVIRPALAVVLAAFGAPHEIVEARKRRFAARPVGAIEVLSPAERRQIAAWSAGPPLAPADLCLHELIAAQVARTPDAVALVCGDERLSYRELWQRDERPAEQLQRLQVGPEPRVGVCARRSPDRVVGLLGVLQAGGAYVPLDPRGPVTRAARILRNCGARAVITTGARGEALVAECRADAAGVVGQDLDLDKLAMLAS